MMPPPPKPSTPVNPVVGSISSHDIEAARKSEMSYVEKITTMETPKLLRLMRLINVGLGILMSLAGFSGLFGFITLNVTGSLISLYVILFSFVLILFECRLQSMEVKIRENFGFLFTYKGRAAFVFFVGFMCFGMDTALGYLSGSLMVLNSFFNAFVMFKHPDFRSGVISASGDPTTGYTTGSEEAAGFLARNPNLAMKAGTMAMQASANPRV